MRPGFAADASLNGQDPMSYAARDERLDVKSQAEVEMLIGELAGLSDFLRAAVASAGATLLRRRPGPDAFSLHEQIWHLRDIEVLGYALRFRGVAQEERPFLADIDGAQLAKERHYLELPIEAGLEEFAAARSSNVAFLRSLAPDRFARRGDMEGVGCVTLCRLAVMLREHDDAHRREIRELFSALQRPAPGTGPTHI
jgi:hypothetical protein